MALHGSPNGSNIFSHIAYHFKKGSFRWMVIAHNCQVNKMDVARLCSMYGIYLFIYIGSFSYVTVIKSSALSFLSVDPLPVTSDPISQTFVRCPDLTRPDL